MYRNTISNTISRSLIVTILYVLLANLAPGVGPQLAPAQAQPLPPRPTISPTAISEDDDKQDEGNQKPMPTGRITGTVIDLTTGVPAPGIRVLVGDVTVISDSNGNYDRNGLLPGMYQISLVLTAEQGHPAQDIVTVELPPGATIVQHLNLYSLQAATAVPILPTPISSTTPPIALPTTGKTTDKGDLWILGLGLLALGVVLHRIRAANY